jgi:hypothetical protein
MESFNKINNIKLKYTELMFELDKAKAKCLTKCSSMDNINERVEEYMKCTDESTTKIKQDIVDFKCHYNIKEDDEYKVYSHIDKLYSKDDIEQAHKEFPLPKETKWLNIFNSYNYNNKSYLQNYFDSNTNYLYGNISKQSLRELCWNKKTFDGTNILAEDMIKCVNKVKEFESK